jgi:hypothetical protein
MSNTSRFLTGQPEPTALQSATLAEITGRCGSDAPPQGWLDAECERLGVSPHMIGAAQNLIVAERFAGQLLAIAAACNLEADVVEQAIREATGRVELLGPDGWEFVPEGMEILAVVGEDGFDGDQQVPAASDPGRMVSPIQFAIDDFPIVDLSHEIVTIELRHLATDTRFTTDVARDDDTLWLIDYVSEPNPEREQVIRLHVNPGEGGIRHLRG